jgi:hypothetical protein
MVISLQVTYVEPKDDGTAVVWLTWPVYEPGTSALTVIPAHCEHRNVKAGDWWHITLTPTPAKAVG